MCEVAYRKAVVVANEGDSDGKVTYQRDRVDTHRVGTPNDPAGERENPLSIEGGTAL